MPNTSATGESSFLSIIAHLCALFTSLFVSVLGPILILAAADDETVKQNARESLNFQLTMFIYGLISFALCLVFVGFIMLIVVGLWSIIAPIFAMIHVANHPETPHRYSGIIHFFK